MQIARLAALTLIAFVVIAASAAAESFCVSDPACVTAGGASEPSIPTALSAIAAGDPAVPATLTIGAGTFIGPFSYFNARPLTITGAGTTTKLQASGDNTRVLGLGGNSSDSVSSLSIAITSGNNVTGMGLAGGASADHVNITTPQSSVPAVGVNISGGGTITNATIEVDAVDDNADTSYGVFSSGGSAIDSNISAPIPFGTGTNASAFVVRDALQATDTGVSCVQSSCRVEDSLIDVSDPGTGFGPFDGLLAECGGTNASAITAVNDTILGSMRYGVSAFGCSGGFGHTAVSVDSSILLGATQELHAEQPIGDTSPVSITPTYDAYNGSFGQDPAHNAIIVGLHGVGWVNSDPMCITRDCGIGWNSPAVDAGNPAGLMFFDSTTDLAGRPRVVNGRRDIGAFEYQRTAPVTAIHQDLTSAAVGQTIHFDGTASGDADRDPITYAWKADDGAAGTAVTFAHAFTTRGPHTVTLTVTDTTHLTATATAAVTVTGTSTIPPPPKLTALRESATKWRLGNALAHLTRTRKPPVGTSFSFKLNVAAAVGFKFTHAGRCGRHHKRCTITDGTLTLSGHAGADKVGFDGRLSAKRRLKLGRYTVFVTAAAGGHTTAPQRLSFTIVKR